MRQEIHKKIAEAMHALPPLPQTVQKVCELTEKDAAIEQIAQVISVDPILSTKILRLANSSFYGFSSTISSISQAVVVLGCHCVRNIALSISLIGKGNTHEPQICLNSADLWVHSISTAIAASEIAKKIDEIEADEMFTIGLLHDIGKIILAQSFPEQYAEVIKKSNQECKLLYEVENEFFDTDYAQVGREVCEYLELPATITKAINFQNEAISDGSSKQEVLSKQIIKLADMIARIARLGDDGNFLIEANCLAFLGKHDFPLKNIHLLCQELPNKTKETIALLEMNELNNHLINHDQKKSKKVGVLCSKEKYHDIIKLTTASVGHEISSIAALKQRPEEIDLVIVDESLSENNSNYLKKHNIPTLAFQQWVQKNNNSQYYDIKNLFSWLQQEIATHARVR